MIYGFNVRGNEFPYYIVRFKQGVAMFSFLKKHSFHTTQYDLNEIWLNDKDSSDVGFHTTQYDLNLYSSITKSGSTKRFPYYIVRFKHARGERTYKNPIKFPYYIVRFKLLLIFQAGRIFPSFHTTQYDLNLSIVIHGVIKKKFPYYIVRFKPNIGESQEITPKKFPYYIVRFKPSAHI